MIRKRLFLTLLSSVLAAGWARADDISIDVELSMPTEPAYDNLSFAGSVHIMNIVAYDESGNPITNEDVTQELSTRLRLNPTRDRKSYEISGMGYLRMFIKLKDTVQPLSITYPLMGSKTVTLAEGVDYYKITIPLDWVKKPRFDTLDELLAAGVKVFDQPMDEPAPIPVPEMMEPAPEPAVHPE